jgi:hypothetical protein
MEIIRPVIQRLQEQLVTIRRGGTPGAPAVSRVDGGARVLCRRAVVSVVVKESESGSRQDAAVMSVCGAEK